jgi:hypothetical protein
MMTSAVFSYADQVGWWQMIIFDKPIRKKEITYIKVRIGNDRIQSQVNYRYSAGT